MISKGMSKTVILVLAMLGLSIPVYGQGEEAPTVVMVFRHAEKAADQGRDPSLTEAGQQRAETLLDVAGDAGVTAIFSSQFKRTQETVAPLAEHLGITVTTLEISGANMATYPATLAKTILTQHRGETVAVVNHSNTVPLIVEALGGVPMDEITEEEYDDYVIVIIPASGPVRTIRAAYGQ